MNSENKSRKNNKLSSTLKSGISYIAFLVVLSGIFRYGFHKKMYEIMDTYEYSTLLNDDNFDDYINKLQNEFSINVEEDKKDELLLLYSIYENMNLSQEEKNVFYGFYSLIDEIKYLDRDKAYESLSKVSVNHIPRDENTNEYTLGNYDTASKRINIYASDDSDNKVLLHEGVHCLFSNDKNRKLPKYFCEGITELLVNEYFSNDPFYETSAYPYEVAYVKMLCELIGTDTVIKAYCTGDFNLVTDEMDKYGTSLTGKEILDIYEDSYNVIEKKEESKYTDTDRWKAYDAIDYIYIKSHPNFENYQDFKYLYELSASSFEKNPTVFYINYVNFYGVLEKGYFSESLKSNFSTSSYKSVPERSKVYVKSKLHGNLTSN